VRFPNRTLLSVVRQRSASSKSKSFMVQLLPAA
jgi:hypothetical protein